MVNAHHLDPKLALGELSGFRREFHRCLTRRADGLFELADAVRGRNEHRMIPGWPYSFVTALETGGTSWTALPAGGPTATRRGRRRGDRRATARAGERLIAAGHWTC
ncbi:hypothetical protein [Saccharothrix lopnurensis]|uniref:Uncharacterized protein n=1 Tax=Saccharothrix lopnurensis TaxID=1670621 RepID=A0ABW1P6P1_9PSEU